MIIMFARKKWWPIAKIAAHHWRDRGYGHALLFLSAAEAPILNLLRWRFFCPAGQQILVKFTAIEGPSVMQNFTSIGPYLGLSGPKTPKIAKSAK